MATRPLPTDQASAVAPDVLGVKEDPGQEAKVKSEIVESEGTSRSTAAVPIPGRMNMYSSNGGAVNLAIKSSETINAQV